MLLNEKEARAITEKLLGHVKADDAVVNVGSENYSQLRFAANAFTTSGARENVTANVTVWIDKKRGAASTNEIDDASLKATVEQQKILSILKAISFMPTLSGDSSPMPLPQKPAKGFRSD